ncbi:hypothetical protein [Polaribacter sp. 11A2H]|uniref:hypothetical protein n=1 Tax=Polaribacter sp. 11A2H TaxID=2687290 RepID=UPI001407503F|nr:hypothetical protein [Polaribacter sp. 11A2H]
MDFHTEKVKGKNKRLIVEEDKEVIISLFYQKKTYSGVSSEKPNKQINENILNQVKGWGSGTYLIEPPKIKLPFFKIYKRVLPSVMCRVDVSYDGWIEDCDSSSLSIVWFQDDYAYPIEKNIIEKIKKIPYSKVCNKYSY